MYSKPTPSISSISIVSCAVVNSAYTVVIKTKGRAPFQVVSTNQSLATFEQVI
jgi:hypothetical protein